MRACYTCIWYFYVYIRLVLILRFVEFLLLPLLAISSFRQNKLEKFKHDQLKFRGCSRGLKYIIDFKWKNKFVQFYLNRFKEITVLCCINCNTFSLIVYATSPG